MEKAGGGGGVMGLMGRRLLLLGGGSLNLRSNPVWVGSGGCAGGSEFPLGSQLLKPESFGLGE